MKVTFKDFLPYLFFFMVEMVCILAFKEYAIAVLAICVHGWMKRSADKLSQKIKAAKIAKIVLNDEEDSNYDK